MSSSVYWPYSYSQNMSSHYSLPSPVKAHLLFPSRTVGSWSSPSQTLICPEKGGTPAAAGPLQGQQGAMATAPVSNSISSPLLHLCPLSPEAGSFFNLESMQDGSWLLCQQQLLLTGLTVTQEAISRSDCRPQGTTASSLAWPRAPASKTPAGCCQASRGS